MIRMTGSPYNYRLGKCCHGARAAQLLLLHATLHRCTASYAIFSPPISNLESLDQ